MGTDFQAIKRIGLTLLLLPSYSAPTQVLVLREIGRSGKSGIKNFLTFAEVGFQGERF